MGENRVADLTDRVEALEYVVMNLAILLEKSQKLNEKINQEWENRRDKPYLETHLTNLRDCLNELDSSNTP